MRKRGHFVVIEGTDGSGKATQTKLLRRFLQILNYPHQVISFPRYGGNPYSKLIEKYLRGEFGDLNNDVGTYLVSLAYAGDRFLAKPLIQRWLAEGDMVIADRYVPSNKAFMAAKLPSELRQDFIEWMDDLEYNINGIPREEMVIFLYMPSEKTFENIAQKKVREHLEGQERDIHESNIKYQEEVGKLYLNMAKTEPNWQIIECLNKKGELKKPEEIHQEIVDVLKQEGILKGV